MTRYIRLKSNKSGATGVVLVEGDTDTGYSWRWRDPRAGVFGAVVQEAIMSSSIDQSPVKVAQREGSRVFPLPVEIRGTDWDSYVTLRDALIAELRDVNEYGGRLRVRPLGSSAAMEFVIQHVSAGALHSALSELQFRHEVDLQFTCSPYAYGDPMDVSDEFSTDTLGIGGVYNNAGADWDVVSGAPVVSGGMLDAAAGSAAAVVVHTGTPYTIGDNQQTVEFQFSAQASSNAVGVILKRLSDGSHLRVVIDDNGTASTLRIQKVTSGVASDLGTPTNLSARVPAATARWLRGRIEGNTVIAEYHTSAPKLLAVSTEAATLISTTLAGADATAFGDMVEGDTGVFMSPTASAAIRIYSWARFVYTYIGVSSTTGAAGALASPITVSTTGVIPGGAPPTVSVRGRCTPVGGAFSLTLSAVPRYASQPLFGALDLSASNAYSGTFSNVAGASYFGGSYARMDSTSGSLWRDLYPSATQPPDGSSTLFVRISARVWLKAAASLPEIGASIINSVGTTYPLEFGSTLRSLSQYVSPVSDRVVMVNLGTIALPDASEDNTSSVSLYVSLSSGSAQHVGVDMIECVPLNFGVATTPVGVRSDLTVAIAPILTQIEIDDRLSGWRISTAADGTVTRPSRQAGLMGRMPRLSPGSAAAWFISPGALLTDDPYVGSISHSHPSTGVQVSVHPRYWIGG